MTIYCRKRKSETKVMTDWSATNDKKEKKMLSFEKNILLLFKKKNLGSF